MQPMPPWGAAVVCAGWGRQLRTVWETENYAQLGQRVGGETTVLAAAVIQILTSMASMKRMLQKLVAMQEVPPRSPATTSSCCAPTEPSAPRCTNVIAEAHSLATVGNPDTAPNVWLLAGGPGDSSTYSMCF
ncbi:hypothetical protein GN958_ATG03984 [Phytophthora infestans]|uniref:Uncharacterized protein n=1 Tax=Phytophthora infestans TaxID=4787 RepID=A0A8S9V412_PHYIN|nr:hypothetical protein GN958_ATG03984 [Phytophthora infestans]